MFNEDGQYLEINVVFYDKSIKKEIKRKKYRFYGATIEEVYGANGCHEVFHNDISQIALDEEEPTEEKQDPKLNKPLNSEINYRREYHKKFPNKGKKDWEKVYKNLKYYGLN